MARYTLKTFYGAKQVERFDHRSTSNLRSILDHPRFHQEGQTGPFGEEEQHPNRFEILDSMMYKIFEGNIEQTEAFVRSLR